MALSVIESQEALLAAAQHDKSEAAKLQRKYERSKRDLADANEALAAERAQRETFVQSNFEPRRRLVPLPDPPYLSDGRNLTFSEWQQKMTAKLTVETQNFKDGDHQIEYVRSRTSGRAQKLLEIYTRTTGVFPHVTDVFEQLREHLDDHNKEEHMLNAYDELEHEGLEMSDFLLKFLEYSSYQTKSDVQLIRECTNKLNPRMRRWAQNLDKKMTVFSDFRKRLIEVDDAHKADLSRRSREQQKTQKAPIRAITPKLTVVPTGAPKLTVTKPTIAFEPKDRQQKMD